ncbi:MAG TPA: GNAT family N-acetyltransferase [Candidatus Limnocylindrales bacterium]|jgi:ribosomal protein S18 acetylase RimI-like enzyme
MTTTLTQLPEARTGSGVTYRRFTGLEDLPGMGAANARLRAMAGILEPIDLDAMRHRYTHLVNSDPLVDCLVVERDGATVGYGRVEWHDLVDGDRIYDTTVVVEPDAWGLGIAGALVDWGERRCRELAARNQTDRRTWLANFSFDRDTEVEEALRARGYEPVRWDAEMLRPDLEHLPEVVLAEGYELRTPIQAELPAVFEMSVLAFAEHWGQSEDDEHEFEEWADDPRFRLDLQVVAWKDGQPAALVSNVLETRDDGSVMGLLNGVCTHPDHRRLGLARAAISESLRLLRDQGATGAFLGVDTDNHNRAIELYRSCGFEVATSSTSYRKAFDAQEDRR